MRDVQLMKGVILHGGKGARLRPLTHTGPKQLIAIANKPISQYVLEHLRRTGITKIGMVLGDTGAQKVIDYYGDGSKFGVKIDYVYQGAPKGIVRAGIPSNSIIEAMSSSLPIIIVDYSSRRHEYDTSDFLENDNGLAFGEGDAKELSSAIQKLADDDELKRSMGRRGRQLIEEKLNWKTISVMTTDAYERAKH